MHRFPRVAGFLAIVALAGTGCGQKSKPEMPEPVNEAPPPSLSVENPVSEPIEKPAENRLDGSQRATLEERISFAFDQSDLTSAARQTLAAKAEILRQFPSIALQIEGHADERGSDEYNLALSNRRAVSAMRFLVQQGVAANRLATVGYGEERPLDSAETESAWAVNRRDEFRVSVGPLAQQ
jgi:peptidoglycan-associated lipoprotein